jgi:transposase
MRRHEIKDEDGVRINDLLPGQPGDPGVTAKDHRLFVNAGRGIAQTGAPWRDRPERFGPRGSVGKRYDRWAKTGVGERVFEALRDPDLEWMSLDGPVVRAHPQAAGAEKEGGPTTTRWADRAAGPRPRSTAPSLRGGTRSSSS